MRLVGNDQEAFFPFGDDGQAGWNLAERERIEKSAVSVEDEDGSVGHRHDPFLEAVADQVAGDDLLDRLAELAWGERMTPSDPTVFVDARESDVPAPRSERMTLSSV